jgi:hypothetical protein
VGESLKIEELRLNIYGTTYKMIVDFSGCGQELRNES